MFDDNNLLIGTCVGAFTLIIGLMSLDMHNQKNALDGQMKNAFNSAGYKVEAAALGWSNDNARNAYIVSRNDSLFEVTADYKKVGNSSYKKAGIVSNTFTGMKTASL